MASVNETAEAGSTIQPTAKSEASTADDAGTANYHRLLILGVPLAALALGPVLAWAIAGRPADGVVADRVVVDGRPIGGRSAASLDGTLEQIDADLAGSTIDLIVGAETLKVRSADLGLQTNRDATTADALAIGRTDSVLLRPWRWAVSLAFPRRVDLRLDASETQVAVALADIPATIPRQPIEPTLRFDDDKLILTAGASGEGAAPSDVTEAIRASPTRSHDSFQVEISLVPLAPIVSEAQAAELARRVAESTSGDIPVRVGPRRSSVAGPNLRPHLAIGSMAGEAVITLNEDGVGELLEDLFPNMIRKPIDASIKVVRGDVQIDPGHPGLKCCAPAAAEVLAAALTTGSIGTGGIDEVELPVIEVPAAVTENAIRELGVTEEIGSFTTKYPAGQTRVKNIHRIAELVDGEMIEPRGTFSLNERVGPRTKTNGFVAAGVIYLGTLTDDVGGGISQFATTLFNAAFFGGLDLVDYQSHSLYFSRYPKGREATISYPDPDLVIGNPSDHHILVSTSVTDTSVTVTLFSTSFAEVTETGRSTTSQDQCTRVTTTRERRWLDTDEVEKDSVFALYRPDEGLNCAGELVEPPPEEVVPDPGVTTTVPVPTTVAPPNGGGSPPPTTTVVPTIAVPTTVVPTTQAPIPATSTTVTPTPTTIQPTPTTQVAPTTIAPEE